MPVKKHTSSKWSPSVRVIGAGRSTIVGIAVEKRSIHREQLVRGNCFNVALTAEHKPLRPLSVEFIGSHPSLTEIESTISLLDTCDSLKVSNDCSVKHSKFPSPGVICLVPWKKTISGRGKPELTHRMFTEFRPWKQLALEIRSSVMTTTTAEDKKYKKSQDHQLFPMRTSIPGGVTNTNYFVGKCCTVCCCYVGSDGESEVERGCPSR